MPKDNEEMEKNVKQYYDGKWLLREIALFGGANSYHAKLIHVLCISSLRSFIPFIVRWY